MEFPKPVTPYSPRFNTPDRLERDRTVLRLYSDGLIMTDIAGRLGINERTVVLCLRRYGVRARPRHKLAPKDNLTNHQRHRKKILSTPEGRRRIRGYKLKDAYGIGIDEYESMEEEQGHLCAVCKSPPGGGRGKGLVVDHDHDTGAVRALLCHRCNAGLGSFLDDPTLLRRAAAYLAEHSEGADHIALTA